MERRSGIAQKVGAQTHLVPASDLGLVPRAVTVLLGATQAGKTTLMRVMARLDTRRPKAGSADQGRPGCRCASATWRWSTSSSSTTRR